MRILTFNWHETYICMLAKTGHQFEIVERFKGGSKRWLTQIRPIPSNATIIGEQVAQQRLEDGWYDLVICHNPQDLQQVGTYELPKIMVFHNKLSTEIALGGNQIRKGDYLEDIRVLVSNIVNLRLVFISENKRDDWGLSGEVILPGIDLEEYYGYEGTEPRVLRVGNFMKERDLMMGFTVGEEILKEVPSTILGINPSLSGSRLSRSWEDLKEHFRLHRLYLNTTVEGWEDGYNLAMLEAMATGMPVVSTFNSTSPLVDGYNGYISNDIDYLREKVLHLLEERDQAIRLGENARKTVEERFNIKDFIHRWREVMEDSVGSLSRRVKVYRGVGKPLLSRAKGPDLHRILLAYVSYPATTARYLEKSLRKSHEVITVGPSIWPELIRLWKLENMKEEVRPHDIPCGFDVDMDDILGKLPSGWRPDLFLWVESVNGYLPRGITGLPFPTACYLIDSHINLNEHLKVAGKFDFVFVAQKEYLEEFRRAGLERVHWIPLGCDPDIHRKFDVAKAYDISFVGSLTPDHRERRRLLGVLCNHFDVRIDRCFLEEMAQAFSRARIVFNKSVRGDLNMRVFEALSCGSMLLTDEGPRSGLGELFKDREHLVIYRDEKELVDLARYYLLHPEEREEIALRGREEVLRKHTYDHRTDEMLKVIVRGLSRRPSPKGPAPAVQKPKSLQVQPYRQRVDLRLHAAKAHDYYEKEREEIVGLIPKTVVRILDVGCGAGRMGRRMKQLRKVEVVGVEINPRIAREAEQYLDQVIVGDIEVLSLPFPARSFDCIICADVLEHLRDPGTTLKKLRRYLSDDGVLIASIPNVRFLGVINHLVEGNWTYQAEGILDETHLRFFTRREMIRLFQSSGYEVQNVFANLSTDYEKFGRSGDGTLRFGRVTIEGLNQDELKDFFVFQYLLTARKKEDGHDSGGES
ncbi:MAG TPA: methyltransferase domain-containing protein [Candidatus Latescibacteria bacterium]|nr:methyltransferase domain-containing protein [Candidatus Latescibacterota bacterium]